MPIGRWGHREYVFRWCNLCRRSCERASAIHGLGGGIRESRACEEGGSAWYASAQVDVLAHGSISTCSVSPGLLRGEGSWTCAAAKNKLCCVREVNWCCNVMVKWYRQSSETGPRPAGFMRLNGAAASAEVDHILTGVVEILFYQVNAHVAQVQTSWPNIDAAMGRLTHTSVFVHVGMYCDTLFLQSRPMLEYDSSWVTALMPWQHRKRQFFGEM